MGIKHACLTCGRLTEGKRCPEHARQYARDRKQAGRTGARGSTRAGRKVRAEVLDEAKDATGTSRCFYCGAEATQTDHFIPVSRGGPDTKANQVAACASCNGDKGDKLFPSEWTPKGGRKITTPGHRTPPGPQARKNSRG